MRLNASFSMFGLLFVVLLVGCGSQRYAVPSSDTHALERSASADGRDARLASGGTLYVADEDLLAYSLPLTSASQPEVAIGGLGELRSLAITKGPTTSNLHAGDDANNRIYTFALPLSAGSKPINSVSADTPAGLAVSNGLIYTTDWDYDDLNVLAIPMRQYAKPVATIQGNFRVPWGVAISGNMLYVADENLSQIYGYTLPIVTNEQSSLTISGLANPTGLLASAKHLYVANSYSLLDYKLPYNPKNPPVEIDTDVGTFQGLATDGTNLYATYGDDEIVVYPLPLTHDELPSLTLTLPYEYPNALAVGP